MGSEHRKHRRFALPLPVRVKTGGSSEAQASARDVSARGVYIIMAEPCQVGSTLEFELVLPRELSGGSLVQVRCRGRVLRVERPDASGKIGVAATIEKYVFIRAD